MKLRSLLFFVLLATFAATGCLFSPDDNGDDGGGVTPDLPEADTLEQLIANFKTAYNERNIDYYQIVLSENYKFVAKDNAGDYNYTEDVEIHRKMFNGETGVGQIAIEDVSVISLVGVESWQETPSNDPHFGTAGESWFRPFDVAIDFSISGQSLTYQVRGLVIFYASREGEVFKLLGQTDNTNGS